MDVMCNVNSVPCSLTKDKIRETTIHYRSQFGHLDYYVEIATRRFGFSDGHTLTIRIGKINRASKLRFECDLDVSDIHGAIIGTIQSFLMELD